ncbi:MAG: HAD-IA family hydrolase [Planctomycetes bacterium]|nr:HAD-IA family hydrolase [Planctomycetota bacterium]
MKQIRTVYFDVGGTILTAYPSVGEIYARSARPKGYRVDPRAIDRNFKAAWKQSQARRQAEGYACDDAVLRAEWRRVVIDSFADLVPRAVVEEIFDDLYERFCLPDAWKVADGAVETFEELTRHGVRLGILSNWDSRLEETLRRLEVLDFFEHLVISFQVGVEKPHPKIFREAIRIAGIAPEEILHVGDSFEGDIQPALALGLKALWISGENGQSPAAEPEPAWGEVPAFTNVLSYIQRFW